MTNPTNLNEVSKEELEVQILLHRKLHVEALQMLVTLGRSLLAYRQQLIDMQLKLREDYTKFETFMTGNTQHLGKSSDEPNNETN